MIYKAGEYIPAGPPNRKNEMKDNEQLRECINSGQVSAAQVVAHAEAGELPEPFGFLLPTERSPAFHYMRRNDENGMSVFSADQMRAALVAERAEVARLREMQKKYQELIFAVARKFPGESRHETALRYINRAESSVSSGTNSALTAPGEKHE